MAAIIPANLISGFKTCGILPFNRSAIVIPGKESTSLNGDNPGETSPPTTTMEKDGCDSTEACSIPDGTGQEYC